MKLLRRAARGVGRSPTASQAKAISAHNRTEPSGIVQCCKSCGTPCACDLCADCLHWQRLHHYVTVAARLAREVES